MSTNAGIDQLRSIEEQFDRDCASVVDSHSLEDIRARYLCRKSGLLTIQLQSLRELPADQRAEFGRIANQLKAKIDATLESLHPAILEREKQTALEQEALDVTLPGSRKRIGHQHPLTIVRKEIEDIFVSMGYTVEDGPEVENTYYNFQALNVRYG